MVAKIRLARGGSKKRPFYRVVVADSRSSRDGKFIEKLGTYNPLLTKDNDQRIVLQADRIEYWLSKGAIPTEKIAHFLRDAGLGKGNKHLKVIDEKRNNVIKLKSAEIEARKKAEAEKAAAEEAERLAAEKAAAEEAAAAEAEAKAAAEAEAAQADAQAAEAPAEEAASEEKPAE